MRNALTIDVEDYFNVTAFSGFIKRKEWDTFPTRVVINTLKILDVLDSFSIKATFFVLGWIAERHPSLIKEIQKRGHEIASHGYGHELIYEIGPKKFREDIKKSKRLLEDITGSKVIGYRAPSYSIVKDSFWALDILCEEGFLYDSSIFPVLHDIYGLPNAKRFPHDVTVSSGMIKEFPLSTLEIQVMRMRYRIPIAGGGYLRLFPVGLIKKAIRHINSKEGQPAVLYFHPWEIDTEQPIIKADFISYFRHYYNISKTLPRIKSILSDFRFALMREIMGIPT